MLPPPISDTQVTGLAGTSTSSAMDLDWHRLRCSQSHLALRLEVLQDEIWITYLSLFLDLMYNFQMDQEVSDLTGLQPEDLEAIEVLRLSSVNSRLCICHLTDHLTDMWIIINLFSFVSLVSLILMINNKYRHMPIKTKTSKDE